MQGSLRVLYDFSVVGECQMHGGRRTGVFRVVDRVAAELAAESSIDLTLAAFQSAWFTPFIADYLRSAPDLSDATLFDPGGPSLRSRLAHLSVQKTEHTRYVWRMANQLRRWKRYEDRRTAMACADVNQYQIIHSPFHWVAPSLRAAARRSGVATITTLHDLIPLRVSGYDDPSHPQFQMLRAMVDELDVHDWVICDSHYTRNDLLREATGVREERVVVVPLAADAWLQPTRQHPARMLRSLGIQCSDDVQYFLTLGTLEARKNLKTTILAFQQFCEQSTSDIRLVLAGNGTEDQRAQIAKQVNPAVAARIHMTGFLPDDQLPDLYSAASAFIYMSTYEGFGLPPLEAMQCGTPTISSNATSIPEVVGDCGILLDPHDVRELAAQMERLLRDPALAAAYRRRGIERAAQFSWHSTAQQILDVYRMAAAANAGGREANIDAV